MTSPDVKPEASATVSVVSLVLALAVSVVEAAVRSAQKLTLVDVAAVILAAADGKPAPASRRSSSMIMPARAACCACARRSPSVLIGPDDPAHRGHDHAEHAA